MSGKIYFDNINEMPLFNWRKCQEELDYKYCRINLDKGQESADEKYWEKVYNTYLAEFGVGKDYLRFMELQLEIADLECDLVIDNNLYAQNLIKRLTRELKDLIDRPAEGDTDTCITYLSKWLGFRLNPKETTVREFYKYLETYEKESELRKAS